MMFVIKILRNMVSAARCRRGFALIAVVIILAMMGIAGGVVTVFMSQLEDIRRERLEIDKLGALKNAITGNEALIINEGRSDFGYIGHMGVIPSSLEDLYKKGAQPSYVFDTDLKAAAGWNGPYITPLVSEFLDTLGIDQYNNSYELINTEFVRGDGETVSARITSLGEDKTSGTADDRSIDLLKREVFSTVTGVVVSTNDQPMRDSGVTLNYPFNGVLSEMITTTNTQGEFTFNNVSFGMRSISAGTKLIYVTDSASEKKGDVWFSIQNSGYNDVSITSMTVVYPTVAFYEQIKIGNSIVFSSTAPRAASGDTITFAAETIAGSGKPTQGVLIRVDTALTTTPDIVIKGSGDSKTIKIYNFKDVQTGNGSTVDMSGTTLTITFSDGSEIQFTAP